MPPDLLHQSRLLTAPWILYDGTCPMCTAGARRYGPLLRRRGFRLETLQSDVGRSFVHDAIDEMKVVTRVCHAQRQGESFASEQPVREAAEHVPVAILGGAEAIAYIARHIWWAVPLAWLWLLPPLRPLFRRLYAWIAARRHCLGTTCRLPEHPHGRLS